MRGYSPSLDRSKVILNRSQVRIQEVVMKAFILKILAGSGIRLAVLSVLILGMASVCQAQASAAPAQPTAKAGASASAPAAVAPGAQPAAQTGQTATAGVAAKGTQEGIKVHGHWTIEVKNPDGKVATHREFENALVGAGGAATLVDLLVGTYVPGGFYIVLDPASGSGPCQSNNGSTNCILLGSLISPTPSSWFSSIPGWTGGCISANNCSPSLTITPNMVSLGYAEGLLFSGSIPGSMTETGTIGTVVLSPEGCETLQTVPVLSTVSPTACASAATPINLNLTSAILTTPVSVTAGQSVSVTVQLSFQ
jgi:hypothetical protein